MKIDAAAAAAFELSNRRSAVNSTPNTVSNKNSQICSSRVEFVFDVTRYRQN